ncbi:hypothetical protein HY993_00325 [Candidatus Micrarchaeota archaeon]|nr:hypothetical protein [Candidatus Micrarchaeota archaeon]
MKGLKQDFSKAVFLVLFVIAGLIASRINFSQLLGAPNQFFTLFQFFAPIAGGFLGSALGAGVIVATQLADFIFLGKEASLLNLLRVLPLVFAAWYFGSNSKQKWEVAVPLLAIALFIAHPVGGQAWFFAAMFWSIPILAKLFFSDNLLAKSLGATFTAHAVGGVVWLYTLPTTPAFWVGLIPVVVYERALFAAGIAVSYVAANAALSRVRLPQFVKISRVLPFSSRA